jgi:hypothetical protein
MNMEDKNMSTLVTVCVTAFNHAPYIRQAIDSFLAQETSFGVEIYVHDDASTDGTTDILREYEAANPGKIKVFYETENQWGEGTYKGGYNRGLLVPAAHGRYIAMCEGDDCWSDSLKLQKQVDYLEAHPESSLCCHAATVIDGVSGKTLGTMGMGDYEHDVTPDELIRNWNIPTASWVYRKGVLDSLDDEWPFDKPAGDFPSVLYASLNGSVHYLPFEMSIYRYQTPGSWTASMANSSKLVSNARRWVDMYENIDRATDERWHSDFVVAAKGSVRKILGACASNAEAELTPLGIEASRIFTAKDWLKVLVKRTARKLGYELIPVGYGSQTKHQLVKIGRSSE